MDPALLETQWIWHPDWKDAADNTAGGFVHFRKFVTVERQPTKPMNIKITADTKYQLYVNGQLVNTGPVKGDAHLWFYDDLDIQPYLKEGENCVIVRVLRFFHTTKYATSFPRLPIPGLFIHASTEAQQCPTIQTDGSWEASLDLSTILRIDQPEDDFLNIYEDVDLARQPELEWVPAQPIRLPKSHGLAPPWVLSPRLIPFPKTTRSNFKALHNVRSPVAQEAWEDFLLGSTASTSLSLPAGTSHHIELEAPHHLTAMLQVRFQRPQSSGSVLRIMYSESYEDTPDFVPYFRCKDDRTDDTKQLYGPEDKYVLAGRLGLDRCIELSEAMGTTEMEAFVPLHFRTFRYLTINIDVSDESDLVLKGFEMDTTHYPLEVTGGFETPNMSRSQEYQSMWQTSTRTLTNCMHDCYEDCPFYEQLQYAMDVRSSCLFTYAVSGDDRMARQAIIQLHNGYRPGVGLIASRGPAHQLQIIPHFSLFWVSTVVDHFDHAGDAEFTRQFLSTSDGIVQAFSRRIDPSLGLVSSDKSSLSTYWDFVDWTNEWRPMGVPTAAGRTGFQTYTNLLYAYTLQRLGRLVKQLGRPGVGQEYQDCAESVKSAVNKHCRIGSFFTDGLASKADPQSDYSQHNQIWAILARAASTDEAQGLLASTLTTLREVYSKDGNSTTPQPAEFTEPSMAMSFYTLRALSEVGGNLYDDAFHTFWEPWRKQLGMNLSTWCEDEVTKRSDCHAWSCAPLYEFMAEVAGVRPAEPGWTSIACSPRTQLFREFRGRVPLGGQFTPGLVEISWTREAGNSGGRNVLISVTIALVGLPKPNVEIPIWVTGPGGRIEKHTGTNISLEFLDESS